MSPSSGRSIRAQLTRLGLAVAALATLLSLAGGLYLALRREQNALDSNLLNSASILSQVPLVAETLEGRASPEELAAFLEAATARTSDIDLILVGDTQGILLYAPDPAQAGQPYPGAKQGGALSGLGPYTSNETGPMGSDHSAYAPILSADGEVLGFIIVGVYLRSLTRTAFTTALRFLGIGVLAAGVGTLLARRLSQRIKRSLMGYEPDDFARLFHQREDILDALEEGILAIDRSATVIFLNAAAAQMLSLDRTAVVGHPLKEVYPHSTLSRVLRSGQAEYNVSVHSLQSIRVQADRMPIYDDGRLAGAVSIFRNRTEIARLSDDLTGVRHMVDAMRAYTHEFTNKLHVILGLLQIGAADKAQAYILETTQGHQEAVSRIMRQIKEPSVAALLVGKTSRAGELGIRLALDRESSLSEGSPWLSPEAFITILGNLIENAIESLNQSSCATKEISVSIREGEDGLLLCVEDTGPGIPVDLRQRLFRPGVSSKGPHRGTGLALVQDVVTACRGSIRVESESGVGTSFFVSFRREDPEEPKEGTACTAL